MQASGRSAKVLGCIFRGPNPGRLESPLSDIFFFCGARAGNNCQHYRGSCRAYAASAELGDFHGQTVPRRLLAANRTSWRRCVPTTSEVIFPTKLRNRAVMTRIEHLQAVFFAQLSL